MHNVVPEEKLKQVLLNNKLEVMQLFDFYNQVVKGACIKLSYRQGDDDITIEEYCGENLDQLRPVGPTTFGMVMEQVDPEVIRWLKRCDYEFKTLPKSLRSTPYTRQEMTHVRNINKVLLGLTIPKGILTLAMDHRLNTDWFKHVEYLDLNSLPGTQVRVERTVTVVDEKTKPRTTAWLVYYGNRPAEYISTHTNAKTLSLKNAIRAVEIIHDTRATVEGPWLAFKVYSHTQTTAVK